MNRSAIRFVEVQYPRQWWLWVIVGGTAAFTSGTFAWVLYVQLVLGEPWADKPASDTGTIVKAVLMIFFAFALLAFFWWAHLRTEVRDDGLYVRFFPFHLSFHRLPLAEVRGVEVVTYSAIMEYSDWGIAYSLGLWGQTKGKAYNVSGNRGVRLTYTTNRHVLIGSQRPDELAAAIESLRESGAGR